MATSGTRSEYRSDRSIGTIIVVDEDASNWEGDTIIISDCTGRTVTFTGDDYSSGVSTATKVDNNDYLFGTYVSDDKEDIAAEIAEAVNLANANGDLSVSATSFSNGFVYLYQLTIPQVFNQGSWKTIGGTAETNGECTTRDFVLSSLHQGGLFSPHYRDTEFPSDELYLKPHVAVSPDHILHHYDLDAVDANFNITGTSNDNPRQAPFSKRFQVIRAIAGNQTTTD